MQRESGRAPDPSGEVLLAPALTQYRPLSDPLPAADVPLAPFVPGAAVAASVVTSTPEPEPEVDSGGPENAWNPQDDTLLLPDEVEEDHDPDQRMASEVAERLEALAVRLRHSGLAALQGASQEPVDIVIAAVLSGYVAARTR